MQLDEELARAAAGNILLEREENDRRWIYTPDSSRLKFGTGQQAEQTILGNYEHPFYGVCVLNDTSKTIYIGFEAGQGIGSPLFCPPQHGIVWPCRYVNLSLAVNPADAAAATAEVGILRLQSPPPAPQVFPYGSTAGGGGLNEAEVLKLIAEHPGPAGPAGPEGKEGKAGSEGKEGKGAAPLSFVGVETINAAITNEPAGFSPLSVGTDGLGVTHLLGAGKVSAAGIGAGGKLFTLPEAHRPVKTKRALATQSTLSANFTIEILTNGEVKNVTAIEANAVICIDDVTFSHEH